MKRLAFIVSHPIQYYVPLYRRLAQRDDLAIRVFFTWHDGRVAVLDRGFGRSIAWDIEMTNGYDLEAVPNVASDPGTHHFLGMQNPSLVQRVLGWHPDVVHVTGWRWLSHLLAMRAIGRRAIPVVFRGDSHLLDAPKAGVRWQIKRAVLGRVFSWPTAFLAVGHANRAYYEAFGVPPERLFECPHSIDVERFAESPDRYEQEAAAWRRELRIEDDRFVLLFAGKLERKKRPVELMRAVQNLGDPRVLLIMLGDGELKNEVDAVAADHPERFRVLPFQNQSRMPVAYRLGDIFVLPSAFGETWGLAVNEAMACGRPVLVSDRVGCAPDVIDSSCGRVFPWLNFKAMMEMVQEMTRNRDTLRAMGRAASVRSRLFDIEHTETAMLNCLNTVLAC